MKKVVIGSVALIAGILLTAGIIISAVLYLPHMTAWSNSYPSRLWFLILAGSSKYHDGVDGLGLGIFFVFGVIMMLSGLGILISEYNKK